MYFNTSYVVIKRVLTKSPVALDNISIHLMLLLNGIDEYATLSFVDFNTSYVVIKPANLLTSNY